MAIKNTKRPTAKKAVAQKMAKPAVAASAPAAMPCGCSADCKCRGGRFLKKLIWFVIIFALGFAACHFCGCRHGKMMPRFEFVNGCVDLSKVPNPQLLEKVVMADVDQDGCVSKDEVKVMKKMMKQEMRRGDRHGEFGPRSEGTAPSPDLERVEG